MMKQSKTENDNTACISYITNVNASYNRRLNCIAGNFISTHVANSADGRRNCNVTFVNITHNDTDLIPDQMDQLITTIGMQEYELLVHVSTMVDTMRQ